MYDVVIIGAGITGTMLARKLSAYDIKIALIDKENDIANGATMANSAIIHTGYDPKDGTLMAELNVKGARAYEELCRQLGCKYKKVGAYIAACGKEEEAHLDILADRAKRRDIPFRFIDADEARKQEPALSQNVTRVLDLYTTAVVYPWEIAIACAEVAKIAGMVSSNVGFHITPRRGEYYVLDKDADIVRHIIFPVPSKEKGKGVLAVPTVYGNTLIGPNSDYVDDPEDNGTSDDGLAYVRGNISKTLVDVPLYRSIRTFAGLRPSSSAGDFVIEELSDAEGFVNAACIESPGLASAPAIADYIIGKFISKRLELREKSGAVMGRKAPLIMAELSPEERSEAIKKEPLYGKIICRCEQISEGEIIDCIRRPCGARSVKGVKKRVRPGMGRCQGGFCEPKVVEILARELGIDPTEVLLDPCGSNILVEVNRP